MEALKETFNITKNTLFDWSIIEKKTNQKIDTNTGTIANADIGEDTGAITIANADIDLVNKMKNMHETIISLENRIDEIEKKYTKKFTDSVLNTTDLSSRCPYYHIPNLVNDVLNPETDLNGNLLGLKLFSTNNLLSSSNLYNNCKNHNNCKKYNNCKNHN